MNDFYDAPFDANHDHVFLGVGHEKNERKTWAVIVLCSAMMITEIVGGSLFGSLALIADGLHMSTHAGAMLIAAIAYTYARKHANDPRFVFGTGKLGDLAGFTSAIILAMIAVLIGYEAIARLWSPIPIHFAEAIPIAVLGLIVNIASAWILSGHDHLGHSHGHGAHDHHQHDHSEEAQQIETANGRLTLSIFEENTPPVFQVRTDSEQTKMAAKDLTVTTTRPDGSQQSFTFTQKKGVLESTTEIPEPHTFEVTVTLPDGEQRLKFAEPELAHDAHGIDARDHNMRAAYIHVIADAAVSVLAIIGLLLAQAFNWLWMDPLAGIVGALVITNWSYGLLRDTGANLVDLNPSDKLGNKIKAAVKTAGDQLLDLHVWRLGPGHFGAIISVKTVEPQRTPRFYHAALCQINGLSHLTVEVNPQAHADTP